MIAALVVLAVLLVGAGGFLLLSGDDDGGGGGGELSAEEQEYADAISSTNDAALQDDITVEESDCVARTYVEVVGLETLQAAVTPDEIRDAPESDLHELGIELGQAETEEIAAATSECLSVKGLILNTTDASDEMRNCLDQELTEEIAAVYVTAQYVGSEAVRGEAETTLNDAASECQGL